MYVGSRETNAPSLHGPHFRILSGLPQIGEKRTGDQTVQCREGDDGPGTTRGQPQAEEEDGADRRRGHEHVQAAGPNKFEQKHGPCEEDYHSRSIPVRNDARQDTRWNVHGVQDGKEVVRDPRRDVPEVRVDLDVEVRDEERVEKSDDVGENSSISVSLGARECPELTGKRRWLQARTEGPSNPRSPLLSARRCVLRAASASGWSGTRP